jgi:8-oxo-dGTP pyrophosphatase MutT (NUDIX family)
MGDSSKAPVANVPRLSAAVILVRERGGEPGGKIEIYLQRRHPKASFMSSAFVFPGGAADPDDRDLRVTAGRELFEEAGVLLGRTPGDADTRAAWRAQLAAGEGTLAALMSGAGDAFDLDALRFFAHWITPSIEPKRFSTVFYLARMPAGQTATIDEREMVDAVWVTPDEALARAGELRLPPPQLRTFLEIREAARAGMDALFAEAACRAAQPHPILPRAVQGSEPGNLVLLLPWDPEYLSHGTGDALVMPAHHRLAVGPSRFVLEGTTWKHIDAASSPGVA